MKPDNIFFVRLRELRLLYKLTQKDLASLLKLKRTSITNYELGLSEPSIETIKKMAKIFGVTTDYLLGHDPDFDKTIIKSYLNK